MDIKELLTKVQNPAWYCGSEYNSVMKDANKVSTRFAFCFPDLYSVGMSHLGIKILYDVLNRRDDVWCERVFAPAPDMETLMRSNNVPLWAIESHDSIRDFNMIGFTLQYELSYSNVLNMLDLAGIPIRAVERDDSFPLIIAGGPCALNPAPLEEFIDLFNFGEGEETLTEIVDLWNKCDHNKTAFLKNAESIPSCYVPKYHKKGNKVSRRILQNLDASPYPQKALVPNAQVIHDRIAMEIMRGCIHGCRFCQAGMIYRPVRQKSPQKVAEDAIQLLKSSGHEEISLTSLSSSDYEKLPELIDTLSEYCTPHNIRVALPSLRIDNFTEEILKKIQTVRETSLTFAPEAGTQRLRDAINKNVTEDDIFRTCKIAFDGGYSNVKLYFMIGLPTETDEDVLSIGTLAQNIVDFYYSNPNKPRGKSISVTISLSTFVPKPFTPFEFEPQISPDEIHRRQQLLKDSIISKKIHLNYHDCDTSVLEAVFARGDQRLCTVLETAWKKGCRLDAWDEHFRFDLWKQAFDDCGLSMDQFAQRRFGFNDELPWEDIDCGISKEFLIRENIKSRNNLTTPNCKKQCSACGVNKICGGDYCGSR